VHNETHVRFVYAHSKRDRRNDDLCFVIQERSLVSVAGLLIESGVIRERAESFFSKIGGKRVDGVSAEAVDYPALVFSIV
jgi:hypothetical protein